MHRSVWCALHRVRLIKPFIPLCLSHLCSSLSWDVNHRMRPTAGKRVKGIADEFDDKNHLTSALHHSPFCLNSARHSKGARMLFFCLFIFSHLSAKGFELIVCPIIHLCLSCQRICQVISNQALSRISTPISIPPHLLTCDGARGGVETDYIWQPKPF